MTDKGYTMIFETERLRIRLADQIEKDIEFFLVLWNHPEVMTSVGLPEGLGISRPEIMTALEHDRSDPLDKHLVAELKTDGTVIGEANLGKPSERGVSETDVKLLPEFWEEGYGTEIKQGLVDYLFTHTTCNVVRATPNKDNIPSQRMQQKVGAQRVGEGVFLFDDEMCVQTIDVQFYVYELTRDRWFELRGKGRQLF